MIKTNEQYEDVFWLLWGFAPKGTSKYEAGKKAIEIFLGLRNDDFEAIRSALESIQKANVYNGFPRYPHIDNVLSFIPKGNE